jgi:Polysaccharide biosynthesis protein
MSIVTAEIARFRTSPMARNATWLLAGQGLGLVLQAVYFVILARLLGPLQYGVYAGAFSFASLVAQYSALGTGASAARHMGCTCHISSATKSALSMNCSKPLMRPDRKKSSESTTRSRGRCSVIARLRAVEGTLTDCVRIFKRPLPSSAARA